MKETRAEHLAVEKLRPFEGHPFKVVDNEEMDQLTWSILTQGLLTPLVVRPLPNGEYQVISGHRRLHACKKAGIETVPALITDMDRDAAAIALVDSNLHREKILPSEKAFAYKMKMDAIKHQGITSGQVVQKWSRDEIAENESGRQVQRYIRLTYLLPELLEKVDEGKIAFTPAVHLSYLSPAEQGWVLDEMERNDCTPSVGQAYHLKEHSMAGTLTRDFVAGLISQEKANQKERLKIPMERIRKYFPKHYTTAQMEDAIVKMCEAQFRRRTDRDAR
ncbi:MAG: ParB/RepB/Spo0J family partition protein [Lachnospiraceae bacterium]|nr:ParB/RepB/Spo0J family partition protein [Lachnospiraceae bacterium]